MIQGWISPSLILALDRIFHCCSTKAILEKTNSESPNHFPDTTQAIQWGKSWVQHFVGCSFPHACTVFPCWLVDTLGKVEAAPQKWLCCVQVTAETQGLPLHLQEGSDPSAPSLPWMDPCGKHALVSFYPVGPAAQAVDYYLTNSICPKILKKLPHHCQSHSSDSLEYSVHCIGHCLHLWSNRNLLVWNANWI